MFEPVSPVLQGLDNGKGFLVRDAVVLFGGVHALGEECDWMIQVVWHLLCENCAISVVGHVCLHSEWPCRVSVGENRGGRDAVVQGLERMLLLLASLPDFKS